jgi:hypothetical protein
VSTVDQKYRGGFEQYVEDCPHRMICSDDYLAVIMFQALADAYLWIRRLEKRGFIFIDMGKFQDIALIDKARGPLRECDWLDCSQMRVHTINFDVDEYVPICSLKGSDVALPVMPDGWSLGDSLHGLNAKIPLKDMNERLTFISHDEGLDTYFDKEGDQYLYAGRPFGGGDELSISNDLLKKGAELVYPYLILMQSNPTPADPNTEQGQRDMQTGMHYLKQAIHLHPHNDFAHWYLGKALQTLDENEAAYHHFKSAYNLCPEEERFSTALMELCWRMENFSETLSIARNSLKEDPKNQERVSDYGFTLLYNGYLSIAVKILEKAYRMDPEDEITKNRLEFAHTVVAEVGNQNQN